MKILLLPIVVLTLLSCGSSETQDQNLNFKSMTEISKDSRPISKANFDTIGREPNVNALVNTGNEVALAPTEVIEPLPKPIEAPGGQNTNAPIKINNKRKASLNKAEKPIKEPTNQTDEDNITVEEFAPLEISKFKQKTQTNGSNNNNSSPAQQVIGHINATNINNGASIIIILKQNLPTEEGIVEAGQRIAAIGYITAGRLNLRFNSVIVNSRIIEIKAKAYDQRDGLEGINLGDQTIKTGGTSGARNAFNNVANGVASLVPGIGGRAAQGITQGVTGSISSKSVNYKLPATDVILITRTNSTNNIY